MKRSVALTIVCLLAQACSSGRGGTSGTGGATTGSGASSASSASATSASSSTATSGSGSTTSSCQGGTGTGTSAGSSGGGLCEYLAPSCDGHEYRVSCTGMACQCSKDGVVTDLLTAGAPGLCNALYAQCTFAGPVGSTGGSTGSGACTVQNAATCTCRSDVDCPQSYTCDVDVTKTCIFQCNTRDDCVGTQAPADVKSTCAGAALGCECEFDPTSFLSECVVKPCAVDAECGAGQVCADGQCAPAPAGAQAADACVVFPEYRVLHVGQPATFSVQAYRAGQPVHLPDGAFTWSAADPAVTAGAAGQFTGAAPSAEVAGPRASLAGAAVSCTARVRVVGPPAAGSLQVTVVDALSGLPVPGATVQLEGAAATQATDAAGLASFAGTGAGVHTVSAFHPDYGYLTVAGTASTDLLLPLLRDDGAQLGGAQGTMANLFDTGTSDVHVAMVGMSQGGGALEGSLGLALGACQPTSITLGSNTYPDVPLPGGSLLGLSASRFKSTFQALGRAGYCAADPAATAAGACGVRTLWGLGGDLPISRLPIDQLTGGGGFCGPGALANVNEGPLLLQVLPVLRNFHSSVVRDQAFTLGPPDASGAVQPQHLAARDLDNGVPPAVRLGLKLNLHAPALPAQGPGLHPNAITALVEADVPGRGGVPLGVAGAVDEDPNTHATDGHVVDENGRADYLIAHVAPAHGGLEGSPYRVRLSAVSLGTPDAPSTTLWARPGACDAAYHGICYAGTVDFSMQVFLATPTGAHFDFASRQLTPPAVAGAEAVRVRFETASHRRWTVWASGAAPFSLPTPPAGFEDRTRSDGTPAGPRSGYEVLAVAAATPFDGLVSFGAGNLTELDARLARSSRASYPAPTIAIVAPSAGATVPAGASVLVTLAGDASGGTAWDVCWSSSAAPITSTATGCAAGGAVPDASGRSTGTLPGSASGSGYLHAVRVDASGAPLAPSVEAAIPLDVQ